jgi:hypothetical protein
MRGFAMVPDLFFYQLVLITLVWLCLSYLLDWLELIAEILHDIKDSLEEVNA